MIIFDQREARFVFLIVEAYFHLSRSDFMSFPVVLLCVPTNLPNLHLGEEKMDALGVDPDLPRDTLVSALLQLCTEDDLRGMRVKLYETALDNGLVHPKDILVKRLKR